MYPSRRCLFAERANTHLGTALQFFRRRCARTDTDAFAARKILYCACARRDANEDNKKAARCWGTTIYDLRSPIRLVERPGLGSVWSGPIPKRQKVPSPSRYQSASCFFFFFSRLCGSCPVGWGWGRRLFACHARFLAISCVFFYACTCRRACVSSFACCAEGGP